jgi:capsular exopolysaccharide synthesis family protein
MAQAGQKTLIVDADLRKPMHPRLPLGKGQSTGLADVLTGTATLDEAIRPTETEGLNVLVSGQSPPNPAELLNSRTLATILEQLQGRYDRILVDSPSVAMVTDAQILATLCGSTLLVLRAERSSRILTQRARDALLAVGVRVAGAIVTDVSPKASRHNCYSGYGYYRPHQGSNGHKAARQEPSTDAAAGSEQGTASPETKESKGEAAHSGQQDEGGKRPTDRAAPLEIKEYDGKAEGKAPPPDRGSHHDRGASTGETKE